MTLHALVPLAGLVLLPGLLVGAALGLRGWLLAGAAPVVTFGIVGIAAPLVPALGLTWSALTLACTAAVLAAGGLGARLALAGRLPNDPPSAEANEIFDGRDQNFCTRIRANSARIIVLFRARSKDVTRN